MGAPLRASTAPAPDKLQPKYSKQNQNQFKKNHGFNLYFSAAVAVELKAGDALKFYSERCSLSAQVECTNYANIN